MPQAQVTKIKYSWQEFGNDLNRIAGMLMEYKTHLKAINGIELKKIYGIPRGGLPLAVCLSYRLGLELITDKDKIDSATLVVDDICDTGETFRKLMTGRKGITFSIFTNQNSKYFVTLVYKLTDGSSWIVFPWETEASSKYDHTKF